MIPTQAINQKMLVMMKQIDERLINWVFKLVILPPVTYIKSLP